ncbi:hypothetical protein HNQ51_001548 [Inhella inkyongensis]|uniref:DUF2189 domain-containing protein n=1 Tax=Inhella inkyongensis TaxID=392593 RepID=A0A840S610_9BURK|nr:BPSS1780 family membrane protein [Inhella inkyongensis]MBB5204234.1 hypothetical protein [Inhella inkyongensis]
MSTALKLTLHQAPAAQGLRWIQLGWQVFRQAPLALSSLLALFLLMAALLQVLGLVGALLGLAALPLVSLAFMLSAHQLLQKRMPSWQVLAQPFKLTRERSHAQLRIGLLYVICTVSVMSLGNWIDGGRFDALQEALAQAGQDSASQKAAEAALAAALADPNFFWAALVRLGGVLLISIPFWHAPALVHWGGQGALQALFSSTLGVWRNKAAFALNGLAWLGLLLAASLALALVAGLFGAPGLLPLLVMPLTLFLASVFYAGLYFMFVDSFRFVAAEVEPAPPVQA